MSTNRTRTRRRRAGAILVLSALALLALAGCQQLIDANLTHEPFLIPDPIDDGDGVPATGIPNVPVVAMGAEAFPLTEGNWWYYRNATADHLPTAHPMREIEYRISDEIVVINGVECFELVISQADFPIEIQYLHREEDGIYEYGREEGGTLTFYASPILVYPRPFEVGGEWTITRGDVETDVRILFRETIIAPESDAIIFQNAWKLEYKTGQQYRYEWFVDGVGLIKMSSAGESYEILTFELQD
ncbi:MAG: hypothetical protein JSW65_03155 [Candidatus Bipolaricaulota bacterium]|nr:MAG: hypothetical protein JSW65_03155 [Candidatus Bipolaricaulota bacterium]